jgi:Arc/MetJ-type ribon-helix-helix transcriptional regulator
MAVAKVAITLDQQLLKEIDRLVEAGEYPNRSRAVQAAVVCLQQQRNRKQRLLAELAKLDPAEERELAEEKMAGEADWPAY